MSYKIYIVNKSSFVNIKSIFIVKTLKHLCFMYSVLYVVIQAMQTSSLYRIHIGTYNGDHYNIQFTMFT